MWEISLWNTHGTELIQLNEDFDLLRFGLLIKRTTIAIRFLRNKAFIEFSAHVKKGAD